MMGRLKSDQGQLFYEFQLGDAVPEDHLTRKIYTALDLSWLRNELAPHDSSMGRPSIDPELMIRMLILRYVFCNSLGAADLSRSAGEPGLSLVLQARHRRCYPGPFGILTRP
jgi:hypothetical protein